MVLLMVHQRVQELPISWMVLMSLIPMEGRPGFFLTPILSKRPRLWESVHLLNTEILQALFSIWLPNLEEMNSPGTLKLIFRAK
ncbi:hypothetical protein ES703_80870 [subsurface metagenome]